MRGSIMAEQAYAQGKMLDHSAWSLPDFITPSDIDLVFERDGKCLFAELSSKHKRWSELKKGQRWLYEALVHDGPHIAVLCFHSVGIERPINSKSDIMCFQPMVWDHGLVVCDPLGRWAWETFVKSFVADPIKSRRNIIAASVNHPDWDAMWARPFDYPERI